MAYKLRHNYTLGGILMGLACIYMGTMMLKSGYEFYGPMFQAYRKWLFPWLKNRLTPAWTWDDLGQLVINIHGIIMCITGLLIMTGSKVVGPCLLIFEMELMMVLQDNPFITEHIKPTPKSTKYRWDNLFRHISVIGVAVLLMAAPVVSDEAEEE